MKKPENLTDLSPFPKPLRLWQAVGTNLQPLFEIRAFVQTSTDVKRTFFVVLIN